MALDTYDTHNPKNPINEIEVYADYVPSVTDVYNSYTEDIPEAVSQYISLQERKISIAKKDISIIAEALEQTNNGLALLLKKVLTNLKIE